MRQARLEAGLKQEALAESIGVAPLSVSHIENGRQAPKVETLERIAEATHRPLAWFFQEPPAPLDRPAAEEAPPPPEPPMTPDLAVLIAQAVGQAVAQAQAPLLEAQTEALQAQARAEERAVEAQDQLRRVADGLAQMRREMESIRSDHQAARQFIREQNRLSDAKYLRQPSPPPIDAGT